jgi:hypothetical protein
MSGGYYNTGQTFSISTLYNYPSCKNTLSSVCTRNNGIVLQTDSVTRSTSTVVVSLLSTGTFGFEDCVNTKQTLQHIDYMQNSKHASTVSNKMIIPELFLNYTDPIVTRNPIVTNGSVFVGTCTVNNMITQNTAVFVIGNYLSSYNIFLNDGFGAILPNKLQLFSISPNGLYIPSSPEQFVPESFYSPTVFNFTVRNGNPSQNTTLTIRVQIQNSTTSSTQFFILSVVCDPKFYFEISQQTAIGAPLHSYVTYNPSGLISFNGYGCYTSETITISTQGSGPGNYTYEIYWYDSDNKPQPFSKNPPGITITKNQTTITDSYQIENISYTFNLNPNVDKTKNFITVITCKIIDNVSNMVYVNPIIIYWGLLKNSTLSSDIKNLNNSSIIIPITASTGELITTAVCIKLIQTALSVSARAEYTSLIAGLQSGQIAASDLVGMSIAGESGGTSVVEGDTAADIIADLLEACAFLA